MKINRKSQEKKSEKKSAGKKFAVRNWRRVPVLPLDEEFDYISQQLQELQEGKMEGKIGVQKAFVISSLPERPDLCRICPEEKKGFFRHLLPKRISKKERKAMKKAEREVLRISRKIEKVPPPKKELISRPKKELQQIEEELARLGRGGVVVEKLESVRTVKPEEKPAKLFFLPLVKKPVEIISPPPAEVVKKPAEPARTVPPPPAPGLLERWKKRREKKRENRIKRRRGEKEEKKERKEEGKEKKINKVSKENKENKEMRIVTELKSKIPKKEFTRLVSELEEAVAHLQEELKR